MIASLPIGYLAALQAVRVGASVLGWRMVPGDLFVGERCAIGQGIDTRLAFGGTKTPLGPFVKHQNVTFVSGLSGMEGRDLFRQNPQIFGVGYLHPGIQAFRRVCLLLTLRWMSPPRSFLNPGIRLLAL